MPVRGDGGIASALAMMATIVLPGDEGLDQHLRHPPQFATVHGVLESRQRRLAGQVATALRQAPDHRFEHRVAAQIGSVVTVFIARSDLIDALGEKLPHLVADL